MNDAQSTIAGLKAQDCPGGGWTGMPAELEGRATVADCLANGVCGCIYGDAAQHIERLRGGLSAAIRAAKLALFVIRKQGVMPNSSWESGFEKDLAIAEAAHEQRAEEAKA
jgi:hypothetical protein